MYNHIKVDMDYTADPLWVSSDKIDEDKPRFCNGSLEEFKDVLSKELLHSLTIYQHLWEKAHWTKFVSPTDEELYNFPCKTEIFQLILKMEISLAQQLKQELPESRVYFMKHNELQPHYELIEV